jgi:hypothetical protein
MPTPVEIYLVHTDDGPKRLRLAFDVLAYAARYSRIITENLPRQVKLQEEVRGYVKLFTVATADDLL